MDTPAFGTGTPRRVTNTVGTALAARTICCSPASPAPEKVKTKAELQAYGYSRRPQSAHIQRAIDERLNVRATTTPPK